MRCVHLTEIFKKCGNKRNMRQSHIHIKLTCLVVLLVISGQGIVSSDDRMTKTNYKFSLNSDNYSTEIALRVCSCFGRRWRLARRGNVTSAGWQVTPIWNVSELP